MAKPEMQNTIVRANFLVLYDTMYNNNSMHSVTSIVLILT